MPIERVLPDKGKGDDTMSAVARDYVYQVKVKDGSKKEPTISAETMKAYKENVAKYLTKKK